MSANPEHPLPHELWEWCRAVLGTFEFVSDPSREHPGQRASLVRLRSPAGGCCLKLHRDRGHWESEVHAYEHWALAFGRFAPRLLAVREIQPLALIISELPGTVLEESSLTTEEKREVWRSAGLALANLHAQDAREFFGPCHRDGSPASRPVRDAAEHMRAEFAGWLERGRRGIFLDPAELATIQQAQALLPVFAGERPTACHRDYCPANWLVQAGAWTGVIDFEFSYADVRSADLTRFPAFDWIDQPGLLEAFFEGYGRTFSAEEKQQIWVSQVLYALTAVVWGCENQYFGFAGDGRKALEYLGERTE